MSREATEGDLLNGICHRDYSATGAGRLSLGFQPVTKTGAALYLLPEHPFEAEGYSSRYLALGFSETVTSVRQEGEQVIGRLARLARGANDGAVVLAQHFE